MLWNVKVVSHMISFLCSCLSFSLMDIMHVLCSFMLISIISIAFASFCFFLFLFSVQRKS